MSQNANVLLAPVTYNRGDYTALRAHCLKIPIAKIADLYYSDDSPQVEMGLERFLLAMRADLVERCIVNNPATAEILQGARQSRAITSRAVEILIKAADAPAPVPHPDHPVSQWFRPLTAKALKAEHIHTLADLTVIMTSRSPVVCRRSVKSSGCSKSDADRKSVGAAALGRAYRASGSEW